MKKTAYFKKLMLLMTLIIAFILPTTAFAATQGSIHIHYYYDNEAIADAVFSAYRVADLTEGGEYISNDAFSAYSISWKDLDADTASELGFTLSSYVSRDNISADVQGKTDANGDMYFNDLQAGIYLVVGDTVTVDDTIYFPQPAVVFVPGWNDNGEQIDDEVTIEPKSEFTKLDAETIERKVLKIWKNDNSEERPSEITVQLLQNGNVYDEQRLNAENEWRYTWSDLDPTYNWQLVEKNVPDGYTVTASQQGITFTVTNTYNEHDKQPQVTTTPDEKLPQTGMLWWPVPVLFGLGAVLCILGVKYRKNSQKSYE